MSSQQLTLHSTIRLVDGYEMPILGYGTYEVDSQDAYDGVTWALEAGYRHIDSATWYDNESECGRAIRDFCARAGTPREDIFYTTKLKINGTRASTTKAIDASLAACGLGYLDLYLIHGPIGGEKARRESWAGVLDAQKAGKIRSVGVSNFGMKHLSEMEAWGMGLPVVQQIDLHPFMTRTDIVEWCKERNVVLQAWAPLVRGMRFRHPAITSLAKKYSKAPAHVLLRYSLQKGFVALPKSVRKERIVENTQIFDFELTEEEMALLDNLDEYLVTDWDPVNCP
ncbi:aldo-keto reductase [Coniophora puteana RWD-64-598 SS2]|uniref:Aldo-keto reductase n=1 Tax=Coniophora puteana (strain RWD-64-598) TaxID=741705 RepID=A0A5M3MY42_CONPW|nr:aldo-keto reductase [Coniophora puteana RWD-64-598 SS2]EIW83694.1 aldo-keto reductase [Coniophora puteana RWD-64-598 SS2]